MSFNIQVISVKLQRGDNTVSWGFNVQGGKEFHSPLVIQKVNHNSLAERGSIKVGDYILRIGNTIAEHLTHNQAREAIIRQGNNLELTLQRGAPPRAEDYVIKYDFPQHQLMNSDQPTSVASSLSPQVGLQLGHNKALLTQSYNSPMGLYSSQNIADTLATTVNNSSNENSLSSELNNDDKNNQIAVNTNSNDKINNLAISTSLSSSSSVSSGIGSLSTSQSVSPIPFPNSTSQQDNIKQQADELSKSKVCKALDLNSKPKPFIMVGSNSLKQEKNEHNLIETTSQQAQYAIEQLSQLKIKEEELLETEGASDFINESDEDKSLSSEIINDGEKLMNESKNMSSTPPPPLLPPPNSKLKLVESKLTVIEPKAPEVSSVTKTSINNKHDVYRAIPLNVENSTTQNTKTNGGNGKLKLIKISPGRDLLKSIERSMSKENELGEEYNNEKSLSNNNKFVLASSNFHRLISNDDSNKFRQNSLKASATTTTPLKYNYQIESKPSLSQIRSNSVYTMSSSTGSGSLKRNYASGHVAKLEDPTKPSVTQSRTFRLLQETLDNGLLENNAVFYDSISQRNQVKRCSLKINQLTNKNNNHEKDENTKQDQSDTVKSNLFRKSTTPRNKLLMFDYQIKSNEDSQTTEISQLTKDTNNNIEKVDKNLNDEKDYDKMFESLKKSIESAAGGLAFHPPSPASLSSPHHYNQPSFNYQRPVPSAAPTAAPAPSSNIAPQPFRNSNLSTNIHGGQRNIKRGTKGSALLNSNPISTNLPTCADCYQLIRGPFISAVGKIWCPNHFVCAQPSCGINLIDVGFVEENNKLYCESDFEKYFAPKCHKCHATIMGECCYALEKSFHPDCFVCGKCKQPFGSGSFHMEDGVPYCTRDFNALFATKCAGCQFPIEAGDKFLDAINQKYHVECFICSTCNVPLGTGGFAAKGNKPFCRKHAY